MRRVAIAFVFMLLAAALPATAQTFTSNACRGLQSESRCHTVEVPPEVPTDGPKTYYVYLAAATCAPEFDSRCTGDSVYQKDAPLSVAGLVWEETNQYGGLQRFEEYLQGTLRKPDTMILV